MIPVLSEALASLPHCLGFSEEEGVSTVEIHRGKLQFVPKSSKTDRTIVVEPWLNSFYQLGYGSYIARCLKRVGVDLSDQTLNQRLAREGSLTGALATLDLSSASDTIAESLVWHLLPFDWAQRLAYLRTRSVELERKDGGAEVVDLVKFSTMGNGYTFALESLIFWALVSSACPLGSTIAVFGDDIVCPTDHVAQVVRVLKAAGFTVNLSKSHWEGPYRESCGKDYVSGFDVRPCFIKDSLTGADLFRLHNYYVRTLQPDMAAFVLEYLDPMIRIYGPDNFGDGHLIGDWVPRLYKRDRGYGGYLFDTFTWSKRSIRHALPGDAVLPVYSVYLLPQEGVEDGWLSLDSAGFRPREVYRGLDFTKECVPVQNLPGTGGSFKRISIYTLSR